MSVKIKKKEREYLTIENSAIHSSRGLRCIAS